MIYSLTTLRWGLEHAFARGGGTFRLVNPEHWVRSSGHDLDTVMGVMADIELAALKHPKEGDLEA